MQKKTTLQTPNEILTVTEPWHRGSGFTWMLLALAGVVFFLSGAVAKAETVTYTLGDTGYYTKHASGGNIFSNAGGAELGMWANFGSKEVVVWRTLKTNGDNTGSNRSLQVGDTFTITVSATSAHGGMGFSLNDNGSTGSYANRTSGSRLFVQEVGTGASWEVNSSGGYTTLDYNASSTRKDYKFEVAVTSESTANVTLTEGSNVKRAYNLSLNGTAGANIDSFSMWLQDDWNGSSNQNLYWKQNTTVQNKGEVELGYYLASNATFTAGKITDGLAANSASTTSANAVKIGGVSGNTVYLASDNTYTGATTINADATAEAQHANAFGSTSVGTTITGGGVLKLYDASGISYAAEALTVNGAGISDAGALRNVGGNNTWAGAVTLGSNSRISSDAGSLTLSGGISGGSNVLYVGGANATTVSSAISGVGASQNGTTTSLFKDGAGTLTLSGNNSYSGDTRVVQGALTVANGGNLGDGTSDVFVSSGATLNVNANTTVASLQETGTGNGGTASIGSGATLTINQASETKYFNALTGEGSLAKSGAGRLLVYGTSSKSGANTVSGGVLEVQSGASLAGATTINDGGTLDAEGTLSGAVTVNSGGTVEGSGSVGALTIASGGTLNPGNSPGTLTAASAIWEGGGHYAWEINDWTGAQGTNWDFLNITGTLLISATTSDFIIDVISLLADNSLGNVPNFAETSTYTFAIATAAGGITGFNADYFTINASGFSNPDAGTWGIAKDGNTINLVYTGSQATAIPEPSSVSLFVFGMAAVLAKRRRVARG